MMEEESQIRILMSSGAPMKSYKITVDSSDEELMLNADSWPTGVSI